MSFTNITSYNQAQRFTFGQNTGNKDSVRMPKRIFVDNITMYGAHTQQSGGISYSKAQDSTFSNITFIGRAWNEVVEGTGTYGLFVEGWNNTARDIYLINNSYGGIANKHGPWLMENIYIENSRHNGFELEVYDSIVNNATVKNSRNTHNFFMVGQSEVELTRANNTLRNIYSENPASTGILITEGMTGVTIENAILVGGKLHMSNTYGNKIINLTHDAIGVTNPSDDILFSLAIYYGYGVFNWADNNTFIDISGQNNNYYDWTMSNAKDNKLINVQSYSFSTSSVTNLTRWYYPNLIITNGTHAIKDAKITFDNQVINGYGDSILEAYTDDNGRLYMNGNRSNWAALKMGTTYTVTAEKESTSNSIELSPSTVWFTTDYSQPGGSLKEITLLGVEGYGLPLSEGNYEIYTHYINDSFTNYTYTNDSWVWSFPENLDSWGVNSPLSSHLTFKFLTTVNGTPSINRYFIDEGIESTNNFTFHGKMQSSGTTYFTDNYNRMIYRIYADSTTGSNYIEFSIQRSFGTREIRVFESRAGTQTQLGSTVTWTTSATLQNPEFLIDYADGVFNVSYKRGTGDTEWIPYITNQEAYSQDYKYVRITGSQGGGASFSSATDFINVAIRDARLEIPPLAITDKYPIAPFVYSNETNSQTFSVVTNMNSNISLYKSGELIQTFNNTNNAEYTFNNLDNGIYDIQYIVENNGEIDGYGWLWQVDLLQFEEEPATPPTMIVLTVIISSVVVRTAIRTSLFRRR